MPDLKPVSNHTRTQRYYLAASQTPATLDELRVLTVPSATGPIPLQQVATVAEKQPQTFKDGYPDVDWQGINRMRNLVAHHYDRVSHDLVWAALSVRIPELGSRLSAN